MLALKVEYLTGVCMATRHDDPSRSTPEWPPHPDRLYSALVAAAAEPRDGDDEAAKAHIPREAMRALRWLAKQGAPHLSVSDAQHRTSPDIHVPANPHPDEIPKSLEPGRRSKNPEKRKNQLADEVRNLLPVHRTKAALRIPAVIPDDPAAYFIWPNAQPAAHLPVLREICARVTYLGRSRSLVQVSVVGQPPPETHVPDELGDRQLRVPGPDRLDYLIDKYKRDGGKPAPCPVHNYRRVEDGSRRPRTPSPVFDRMFIFKPQRGDPPLPATATLIATQALRRELLKCVHDRVCRCGRWNEGIPRCQDARDCYRAIPTLISGYEPDCSLTKRDHLAFVGLPFVHPWQRHADGTLMGLAILVPRDPTETDLRELAAGLMQLQDTGLSIPGIGVWRLEEVPPDRPPSLTLDVRTWTRPAHVWTTATPKVFGHSPKEKKGGEPKVILDSLGMLGIAPDSVVEIAVGRHSPMWGVPPSWCFKTRRDREPSERPARLIRHVTLRFDRPVPGPIILGCMRHFGLGLMRPLEEP